MRDELSVKLVADIDKSIKDSREYIDMKLDAVNSKVVTLISTGLNDKLGGIESSNVYLRSSIATLDAQMARQQEQIDLAWAQHAKQVENLSAKDRLMEEFRKEFQVVDRNIAKLFEEQTAFSGKVDAEVEELRDILTEKPTDAAVASMVRAEMVSTHSVFEDQLREMSSIVQNVSSSLSAKADREEILHTITERIKKFKAKLGGRETDNDPDAAIGIRK